MATDDLGYYTWKKEYNVDVTVIDEQHQKFIGIMNFLENVIEEKKCKEKLSEIFFSLAHYVEHHLINEEIYFKEYKYPDFNKHKELHNDFINRVVKLQEVSVKGEEETCRELLAYLQNWFEQHILGNNIKAVKYLKQQGTTQ